MGTINVVVKRNGTNISSYTINYIREVDLCSGIGFLALTVDPTCPTITAGDKIVITEGGSKKGTFYVSAITKVPDKGYKIDCQDNSKYLQAYFIPKLMNTNSASSRYWISWILDEAKINYNFTTASSGYILPKDDKIGFEHGYDVVTRLCQQSGWYFFFDENGTCQIGSLTQNWHSPSGTIRESDGNIRKEELYSEDNMLRNKVIVWGGAKETGEKERVYVELTTQTPWDRDANDKRTIVWSNHFIRDYGIAWSMGKKLLDEFSKTVSIKVYEIIGYTDFSVGDVVKCKTKIYKGVARVTSVNTEMGDSGFVSTIVLDERCPRIFGYWSSDDNYVYVGTDGNGVWRRLFGSTTWSDYSSGIVNLNIRDLKIKSGLFICTTNNYRAYTREIGDSAWITLSPTGFIDADTSTEYNLEDLTTAGCAINEATGEMYVGYTHKQDERSWVIKYLPDDSYEIVQIIINPQLRYKNVLYDIDFNGKFLFATVKLGDTITSIHGTWQAWEDVDGKSENTAQAKGESTGRPVMDIELVSTGPKQSDTCITLHSSSGLLVVSSPYIVDNILYVLKTGLFNTKFLIIDLSDGATTTYTISALSEHNIFIYKENDDKFHFVSVYPYPTAAEHHTYVPSTNTLTYKGAPPDYLNASYENIVFGSYVSINDGNLKMVSYNVLTETSNTVDGSNLYDPSAADGDGGSSDVFFSSSGAHCTGGGGTAENVDVLEWRLTGKVAYISMTFSGSFLASGGSTLFEEIQLGGVGSVGGFATFCGGNKKTGKAYGYAACHGQGGSGGNRMGEDRSVIYEFHPYNLHASFSKSYDNASPTYYDTTGWHAFYQWISGSGGWIIGIRQYALIGRFNQTYALVNGRYSPGTFKTKIVNLNTMGSRLANDWLPDMPPVQSSLGIQIDEYDKTVIISKDGAVQSRRIPTGEWVKYFYNARPVNRVWIQTLNRLISYNDRGPDYQYDIYKYQSYEPSQDDFPPVVSGVVSYPATRQKLSSTVSGETFGTIGSLGAPRMEIEISRDSPIVFFGGDPPSETYPRGYGRVYSSPQGASGTVFLSSSALGLANVIGVVQDARVTDVLGMGGMASGIVIGEPLDHARYIKITQPKSASGKGAIYFKKALEVFTAFTFFDSISGHVHKLETTNYEWDVPYVFASISGYPPKFYQLEPGEDNFVEKSTGLPTGNITVIRVDDRV